MRENKHGMASRKGPRNLIRNNDLQGLTSLSTGIEFQEVSPPSANPSNREGPPKTRTAAPTGNRNGGKSKAKATNLRRHEYLSRRVDAISLLLAPPFADDVLLETGEGVR